MKPSNVFLLKMGLVFMTIHLVSSCVEEVENPPTVDLTSRLGNTIIVEAILTDQLLRQEIMLSELSDLGGKESNPISNAEIIVKDDAGNSFVFLESSSGTYRSQIEFSAQQGRQYQVSIELLSGEVLISDWMILDGVSSIQDLKAQRTTSNNGVDGIGIFASVSDTSSENTIRYTYEETYKIIAPTWSPFEFVLLNEFEFDVTARQQEERTCFNTVSSNEIILTNDLASTGGQENQLVRFLGKDNFIISHRYSILIKQFQHSRIGYDFYRVLEAFSSNDNLFSEVQPGLIEGNISSTNSDVEVIGLFDVVSVDEKRLFFDYVDFFPNEPLPEYPFNCRVYSPSVADAIFDGSVEFVGVNDSPDTNELPFFVTLRPCGDCTVLGTNSVPEFWEE